MLTFTDAHRQFQDTTYEHLFQRIHNTDVAYDLTQDVFIGAYRTWVRSGFETPEHALKTLLILAEEEARQYRTGRGRFGE